MPQAEHGGEGERVIDATTGSPKLPSEQPGYYPRFSTLSQQNYWDAATREVVRERVENIPAIRFFTEAEVALLSAVVDRIIPQDDRVAHRRIPIVPVVDHRLAEGSIEGYRYEDMPSDADAHRLGLEAINATADALQGRPFLELEPLKQDLVLKTIHDGEKVAAADIWKKMSIERYWQLLVQDCVTAYYAHPWAWDEIGFGGPAYPRAYMRLERGEPEPWETEEERYEWRAPLTALSDRYEPLGKSTEHSSTAGSGGTH